MSAAASIWDRLRLTPPSRQRQCLAVVRYDPYFAAWQQEQDEISLACHRWKLALAARNPRLKLSKARQSELPLSP